MTLKTAILAVVASVGSFAESVYVFPAYTQPGDPATPPFTYTGGDGGFILLNLDSSTKVAQGYETVDPVSAVISTALTYGGHRGTINYGENIPSGAMGARVNSEVGTMDDQQFVQDGGPDAHLDIDYGNDASVFFSIPTSGVTALLIAEDAGLDPFKLRHCTSVTGGYGSVTGVGCTTVFNGWSSAVQTALVNGLFGTADTGDIDQQFLFLFDAPKTGYFEIRETTNANFFSTRLEIDFVGGGISPVAVPEPSEIGFTLSTVAFLLWLYKRPRPSLFP